MVKITRRRNNAEAVVFDIERQLDSDHPYFIEGSYPYAGFSLGMIEEVEAVDEYTVKFTLEDPYAPCLKNIISSQLSIKPLSLIYI